MAHHTFEELAERSVAIGKAERTGTLSLTFLLFNTDFRIAGSSTPINVSHRIVIYRGHDLQH